MDECAVKRWGDAMRIKGLVDEDFLNFMMPSMYICTSTCDFKCDRESGMSCCQNSSLAKDKAVVVDDDTLIRRYIANPITKAIVFAGLEPFDQFPEIIDFINRLRTGYHRADFVVIYTGYTEDEVQEKVKQLKPYHNIIVKFGRFIPDQEKHYDDVLGVYLASSNQYAKEIC